MNHDSPLFVNYSLSWYLVNSLALPLVLILAMTMAAAAVVAAIAAASGNEW
jgi:peptidoglycan/LPS O-acetylase OafA/YrhL